MKKRKLFKSLLSMILTVSMLSSLVNMPVQAEEETNTPKVSVTKVDNSSITAELPGREPAAEPAMPVVYSEGEQVRVSIILESESTIEKGFAIEDIAENSAALRYRRTLRSEQEEIVSGIEGVTKESLDVVWNLTLAANMISAYVEYEQIDAIKEVPGVKDVVIETMYEPAVVSKGEADPNMATSGAQIGSTNAWAAGYTGAGTRIAVIDTGIDTDHQSFDGEALVYSLKKQAEALGVSYEEYVADLDLLDAEKVAAVADELNVAVDPEKTFISEKVPFGYNYIDNGYDVTHDNDAQGEHGSHVEGIAAANAYIPNPDGEGFVSALDSVSVQGVAPDAQILTMKVFGKGGGAYDSDYMAAIEDAIVLGADSINLSLGSSNPGVSREAEYEYQHILDSLTEKGAVVAISAGNAGVWGDGTLPYGYLYSDDVSFDSVGSPGSYTNSLAVASVDNAGTTGYYFSVGENQIFYTESTDYSNQPMASIAGEQEYIFIDGMGTEEDWAAIGDALKGKVAFCSRGEISFYQKGDYAAEAGALAIVIYNNQPGTIGMDLSDYSHTQPCVSITQEEGMLIRAASTQVTTSDGVVYYTGKMNISDKIGSGITNGSGYTMSSFSSWGVPGSLEMKPEITAPGGNIYSVNGLIPGGTSYENMSGTSMAAPQVAGMAALVAQYIRENDLETKTGRSARQLAQSLLMSTAVPIIEEDSGSYYSVLNQGAGLANVGDAISAQSYIWMDENATASYNDGKVKVELGDDPERTGEYSFSFSINNFSDEDKSYDLSAGFFTQDIFTYYGMDFLDTCTVPLNAQVTWTADGSPVDLSKVEELKNYDFDGDGDIDNQDGQAVLDYTVGNREKLFYQENADFDKDGDIDTYDAYLFFKLLNEGSVTVRAGESVAVGVSVKLNNISDYDDKGAYVEGYVFVDELTSADGALGEAHSIPVLGYYGSWTEPSMYDVGSCLEYLYGEEDRVPYMYSAAGEQAITFNMLTMQYADDQNAYLFGGNPLGLDDQEPYMPERNAINNESGDKFAKLSFSAIRNAAASRFAITDDEGNIYAEAYPGAVDGSFYYSNGGAWMSYVYSLNVNFIPNSAQEGTKLTVGLTLAPEYYVDNEGNVDWDALGEGATFSVPATIDNTAPEISDVVIDTDEAAGTKTLKVTAQDNQYIAGVLLYNGSGTKLLSYDIAKYEIEPGESAVYEFDLEDINSKTSLVQVIDYAFNISTYKITERIGEKNLPDMYAFRPETNQWLTGKLDEQALNYTGYSVADKIYTAAAELDGYIFAATEAGELYVLDIEEPDVETYAGNLGVVLLDMAYNRADGELYGIYRKESGETVLAVIDPLLGTITEKGVIGNGAAYNTLAIDDAGTCYTTVNSADGTVVYQFTADQPSAVSKLELQNTDASEFTGIAANGIQSMEWNPNDGYLYWMQHSDNTAEYLRIDPEQNTLQVLQSDAKYVLSALVIPDKYATGEWAVPADEVAAIEVNPATLELLKGNTAQLTANLKPWTLKDTAVTWTSENEAVAAVNAAGVVTAVAAGETVITAASVKDPSKTASCTVKVTAFPVTIIGALQDEDGNPQIFYWDMENQDSWEGIGALPTDIASAVWNRDSGIDGTSYIYQQNTNGFMYAMDPATGETTVSQDTCLFGAALQDMDIAYYWSKIAGTPVAFGVYNAYLLQANNIMDNSFDTGWNLSAYLSYYTDSSKFTALAWSGVDTSEQPYSDMLFALTDNGYIWTLYYDGTTQIGLGFVPTDLALSYPDYDGQLYNSMIMGDDGNLYLSHFTGETNEIYMLEFDSEAEIFRSTRLGDVGSDVWPAALLRVIPNGDNGASEGAASRKEAFSAATIIGTAEAEVFVPSETVESTEEVPAEAVGSEEAAEEAPAETGELSEEAPEESTGPVEEAPTESTEPAEETPTESTEPTEETPEESTEAAGEVSEESTESAEEVSEEGTEPVGEASEESTEPAEEVPEESTEPEEPIVASDPTLRMKPVNGSLNIAEVMPSVSGTVAEVKDEKSIIVEISAKDDQGNEVKSTNGKFTVKYDPEVLTLTGDNTFADFESVRKDEANGSVTIGYVSLKGIDQGNTVAALSFDLKKDAQELDAKDIAITVVYEEAGASDYDQPYEEELSELHIETEIRGAKEASCTENGYTGDEVCVVCGKVMKKGEVIPALGHKTEIRGAKAATETEDGYTGDEYCTVCGILVRQGVVIPATGKENGDGHTDDHVTEIRGAKDATCDSDGYTGDVYCIDCQKVIRTGTRIPPTGHHWVDVVTAPTATEKGYTTHTCTNCGDSYVDSYTDVLTSVTGTNAAATSDSNNILIWVLLLAVGSGIAALILNRKKWFQS